MNNPKVKFSTINVIEDFHSRLSTVALVSPCYQNRLPLTFIKNSLTVYRL